jgi:hypothetical protein
MQMYCTFVLFINQHFPGLPASGTHCITVTAEEKGADVLILQHLQGGEENHKKSQFGLQHLYEYRSRQLPGLLLVHLR